MTTEPRGTRLGITFRDYEFTDEDFLEFDVEVLFLESLFKALDDDMQKLEPSVSWEDPDGPGIELDQIEHHFGVGLVAIQRYMASVYTWLRVKRDDALSLGPKVRDVPIAEVLNAAANHWKHELDEPDWQPREMTRRPLEALGLNLPKTWIAVNIAHEIGTRSLCELLAPLREWRKAVLEKAKTARSDAAPAG